MNHLHIKKPILLVIDDVAENLILLHKLLRDDYRVKGANDGLRGIQIAQSEAPDLILLDVMMPDMDGFEVCQHLKSNTKTKDIPIIFLTAKSETEDELKGLQLGAIDYLLKPFNPEIVRARIKNHLMIKFTYESSNKKLPSEDDVNIRAKSPHLHLKQTHQKYNITSYKSELTSNLGSRESVSSFIDRMRIFDAKKRRFIDLNTGLIMDATSGKILSRLGKKEVKVLELLILNKGKLTTREELMSFAWNGRVVTDSVINVSISNIRKFLLDFHPDKNGLITTFSGLGYCLNISDLL
jgi:putative two-component system response regulator